MNPQYPPESGDSRKRKRQQQDAAAAQAKPESTFSGIARWLKQGTEGESYEYCNVPVVDVVYTPKDDDDDFLSSMSSPRSERDMLSSINSGDEGLLTSGDEFLSCASDNDEERFLSADEEAHLTGVSDMESQGSKRRKTSVPRQASQTTSTPAQSAFQTELDVISEKTLTSESSFGTPDNSWYDGNQTVIRKSISPSKHSETSTPIAFCVQKEVISSAPAHRSIHDALKSGFSVAAAANPAIGGKIFKDNTPRKETIGGNIGVAGALKGMINVAAAAPAPATAMYGGVKQSQRIEQITQSSGNGLGIVSAIKNVINVATGSTDVPIAGHTVGSGIASALKGIGNIGAVAGAPHTTSDRHKDNVSFDRSTPIGTSGIASALKGIGKGNVGTFAPMGTTGTVPSLKNTGRVGAIDAALHYKHRDAVARVHSTSNVYASNIASVSTYGTTSALVKDGIKVNPDMGIPSALSREKDNIALDNIATSYASSPALSRAKIGKNAAYSLPPTVSKDSRNNLSSNSIKESPAYGTPKGNIKIGTTTFTSSSDMTKSNVTGSYGSSPVASKVNTASASLPTVSRKKDNVNVGYGSSDLLRGEMKKSTTPIGTQGVLVDKTKVPPGYSTYSPITLIDRTRGTFPYDTSPFTSIDNAAVAHSPKVALSYGTTHVASIGKTKLAPVNTISPVPTMDRAKIASSYGTSPIASIYKTKVAPVNTISPVPTIDRSKVAPSYGTLPVASIVKTKVAPVNTISPVPTIDRAKIDSSYGTSPIASIDKTKVAPVNTISPVPTIDRAKVAPSYGTLPVASMDKTKVATVNTISPVPAIDRAKVTPSYGTSPIESIDKARVAPVNTVSPVLTVDKAKVAPYGASLVASIGKVKVAPVNATSPASSVNNTKVGTYGTSPVTSLEKPKIASVDTISPVPTMEKVKVAHCYGTLPAVSKHDIKVSSKPTATIHPRTEKTTKRDNINVAAQPISHSTKEDIAMHTTLSTSLAASKDKMEVIVTNPSTLIVANVVRDTTTEEIKTKDFDTEKCRGADVAIKKATPSQESKPTPTPISKNNDIQNTITPMTTINIASTDTTVDTVKNGDAFVSLNVTETDTIITDTAISDIMDTNITASSDIEDDEKQEAGTKNKNKKKKRKRVSEVTPIVYSARKRKRDCVLLHEIFMQNVDFIMSPPPKSPKSPAVKATNKTDTDKTAKRKVEFTAVKSPSVKKVKAAATNGSKEKDSDFKNTPTKSTSQKTPNKSNELEKVKSKTKSPVTKKHIKKKSKVSKSTAVRSVARKKVETAKKIALKKKNKSIKSPTKRKVKFNALKSPSKKKSLSSTIKSPSKKETSSSTTKSPSKKKSLSSTTKSPSNKEVLYSGVKSSPTKKIKSPAAKHSLKSLAQFNRCSYAEKDRMKIGKYASENGLMAAHIKYKVMHEQLKYVTVQSFRIRYWNHLAMLKEKPQAKVTETTKGVKLDKAITNKETRKRPVLACASKLITSKRSMKSKRKVTAKVTKNKVKKNKAVTPKKSNQPTKLKPKSTTPKVSTPSKRAVSKKSDPSKNAKSRSSGIKKVTRPVKSEKSRIKAKAATTVVKSKQATKVKAIGKKKSKPVSSTSHRQSNNTYTGKERYIMGKYASEHGVMVCARKYMKGNSLRHSTVRDFKNLYEKEIKSAKKENREPVKQFSYKKRGRPFLGTEKNITLPKKSNTGAVKKQKSKGRKAPKKSNTGAVKTQKTKERKAIKKSNTGAVKTQKSKERKAPKRSNTGAVKTQKSKERKAPKKGNKKTQRSKKTKQASSKKPSQQPSYQPKYSWLSRFKNFYLVDNERSTSTVSKSSTKSVDKPSTSADNESNNTNSGFRFSHTQVCELERIFVTQKYISTEESKLIGKALEITPKQIMQWFNNRRKKWRKVMTELEDEVKVQLSQTS